MNVQVGNAKKCAAASMLLMDKYHIYVQDINYPTVARGSEKLRIAPTPFHSPAMQERFVGALVDVWHELGLDFTGKNQHCSYSHQAKDSPDLGGISLAF